MGSREVAEKEDTETSGGLQSPNGRLRRSPAKAFGIPPTPTIAGFLSDFLNRQCNKDL